VLIPVGDSRILHSVTAPLAINWNDCVTFPIVLLVIYLVKKFYEFKRLGSVQQSYKGDALFAKIP